MRKSDELLAQKQKKCSSKSHIEYFVTNNNVWRWKTNIVVAIPFSLLPSKHIKCIKSDGIHVELCEMRKNGIGCYLPDFSAYVKKVAIKKSHSRIDLMIFPSNSPLFSLFLFLSFLPDAKRVFDWKFSVWFNTPTIYSLFYMCKSYALLGSIITYHLLNFGFFPFIFSHRLFERFSTRFVKALIWWKIFRINHRNNIVRALRRMIEERQKSQLKCCFSCSLRDEK